MIVEIVSASEIAQRELNGWTLTGKQTVIAGKLRTAEMQKEGNKFAYIDGETAIKEAYINSLNKADKKRYFNRATLYARGLDI